MLITLLLENYLVFAPILSYLLAQVLKMILYSFMNKKLDFMRLVGSGGMPSSHAATVAALFVAALRQCGPESPITAVALIFAVIVIYDARGVRQETGKHAQLLKHLLQITSPEEFNVRLNEMVGHTLFQVIVGVIIGVVVALCVPVP